jgi:hypothetical protein
MDEIIGDYQCEFRRNRSITDLIFCIRRILDKDGSIMGQYISYLQISGKPMTHAYNPTFSAQVRPLGCNFSPKLFQ